MEPPKYYDINNGLFCVHFPNRRGLSIEEITSIFSEFGDVVTVTKSGDDYGYRFVKYRNEDEVIRCVEGMKNHQFIKLKVKDPNFKKNKNSINNNNVASSSYGQKNYEHNGQKTEFNDNRNRQGFSTPGANETTDNKEQYVNNNNRTPRTEYKHYSIGEQRINEARRGNKIAYDHDTVKQKIHTVQETYCDPFKPVTSLRQPAIASETFKSVHAKTSQDNVNDCSIASYGVSLRAQNAQTKVFSNEAQNSGSVGLPIESNSIVPRVNPDDIVENIPRLVMKNSAHDTALNGDGTKSPRSAGGDTSNSEMAKEVVVANIHTDFGVNYILHLFRKHNPLSISEMKMVSSLGLRFCIVYLQSSHQAYAIEKEFDKFKLAEKDLIVLRSERLAELSA